MKPARSLWYLLFATLTASTANADSQIAGRVIGVSDGDTITLLTPENWQLKVRLAEIDAPEKTQAFGNKSKQSLSDICFGKSAALDVQDVDRYGRTVARVFCGELDANAEQVRRGYAWVYDRFVKDKSLYSLQLNAREQSRGLWTDSAPVPPWEYRRNAKTKSANL